MGRRIFVGAHACLLGTAMTVAVLCSRAGDWHPVSLVVVLCLFTVVSDLRPITFRSHRLSGGFMFVVLAMALLGPAPAVACAVSSIALDARRRRLDLASSVVNLAGFATYPLVGGLIMRVANVEHMDDLRFGMAVMGVFFLTNTLNFMLVVGVDCLRDRLSLIDKVRQLFIPMLPSEALACALTVVVALTYRRFGLLSLLGLVGVLILFQVLTRELLLSQERAEQLEIRTTELASVQVGVLAALLQTLSLRDRMTARHSAAVARFSRAIAEEIGCTPEEQERVHTAGLLHDIGKFAFPDRILFADRKLDEEDWKIVRTHPYQGARLVKSIDGYSIVADIILAHHERIDGRGYPRGLKGDAIPLLSKMISIADTYDVMTSRDSYRKPVGQAEAVAELRRVSGAQLDAELVEAFIRVLERRSIQFQHTTDADFERELDFESRVRGFAVPRAA